MFQVASNFNCLENASVHTKFDNGYYLTNLMSDSTQGPSASSGAIAGAMLRVSSHLAKNTNLLENTSLGLKVVCGKLYASSIKENGKEKETHNLNVDEIMIGLHTNISANFDRSSYGNKCCFYDDKSTIIDQVFTSTIISPNMKDANHTKITKQLLYAAYFGTYLAAVLKETEVVVLTFIGGGCFYNPIRTIIETIAEVHTEIMKLYPFNNIKQVILPIYDKRNSPEDIVGALVNLDYPKDKIIIKEMSN
jgi:hypothetical protein